MAIPEISLIVPAYNRADFLPLTIPLMLKQTYRDFELIIVDDGSTDNTEAIVESFSTDPRIRYIRRDNGGPAAARNTGLENARGDIIVYGDSDDVLYPHCLATIENLYKNDPKVSFATCNHRRTLTLKNSSGKILCVKEDNHDAASATLEDFYNWSVKTTSTGFSHRREPFAGKAEWKSGFLIEDLEFIMQLAMLDETGFRHIPEKLLHYDQVYGGNGMCSGASYADYAHAFGTIYELHKNDPLMKNPDVYLDRVEKYTRQQQDVQDGKIPPPQYKYFPEFWNKAA